ncbi:putative cytochrome P450 oxidoreductase [Mollisia scopiformis]|uniref:Putative cytochrome P450 oxidoreductase n=1 Tax=Mollisia scopiformis TaxID=149040 RepID=A0A194X2B0_MOLSC|nr:putative cytochrome P450 oxidoreductase [Mollisia scopiformis]KUJ14336.1 putative cytochrome P450 oxidoreductase [Mollisia scopiformis]
MVSGFPPVRLLILLIFLSIIFVTASLQAYKRHREARQYYKLFGCRQPPLENAYDPLGISKIIRSTKIFLKKQSLLTAIKLFSEYGNTYTSRVFTSRVVFTCDPRNIRQILVTGFADWESSPLRGHLFKPLLAHSIFQLDGPRWKATRDTYRHQARFSNLRSIIDVSRQEKSVQNLLNCIPDSKPFDLSVLFRHLMMDLTTGFCLGDSANSLTTYQTEEKKVFAEAITDIQHRIATGGFVGPLSRFMSKKQMRIDTEIIHRFVGKYIDATLARLIPYDRVDQKSYEPEGYNMLDALAEFSRDKIELRDYVTTILIAGTESTSSLMSSVLYLLARNEHVFLKLRQSILEIIGREPPTLAQIKGLAYLRCVLNEALRFYPPVPINARIANTSTTLPVGGGSDGNSPVYIHKGQKIVFSSFAIHRSEEVYGSDALVFKPERWENVEALKERGGSFFPFLLGPRACPGQQYALQETSYVIIRLLQTFKEIKPRDSRPWKEHMGLNLRNDNGCWLEVVRDEEAIA